MRKVTATLGKSILLILAGGVAGTVLLVLVYMLPVDSEDWEASFDVLAQEGWYPRASVSVPMNWDFGTHPYITDRLDGFSDEIMLQTALNLDGRDPLLQVASSHNEMGDYPYYWHGYVSLLRPLMLVFDIFDLRIFNCICQLALFAALLYFIGREKGLPYAAMYLTSFLLLMPMALFLSLQFSWVFYVATSGTLVLLRKKDFFASNDRLIYFFIIVGMLTSYLDLLTYPLYTWGMPLIWWLIMDGSQRKRISWCVQVVVSGLSWIAGYAGMWMFKCAMASIVLKRNIILAAINEAIYRSGSMAGVDDYQFSERFQAIYFNWLHYEQIVFAIILVIWMLYWVWAAFRYGWRSSMRGYAYFLIGTSSFVWYFVLANHTALHHFFTYRIFGVTLLAFMAMINDGIVRKKVRQPAGMRLKMVAVWVACCLLAFPLAMCARENVLAANGEEEYRQVMLEQGETIEVAFTPTLNRIKDLLLGLESAGSTGEFEISLWEGEKLIYRSSTPVQDDDQRNFRRFDVDWKLDHKKTYKLAVAVHDNPESTYVWITNGAMPLIEYGELYVGGNAMIGQLLTFVTYSWWPQSKARLLFLMFGWTGILAAASYTFIVPRILERKIRVKNYAPQKHR